MKFVLRRPLFRTLENNGKIIILDLKTSRLLRVKRGIKRVLVDRIPLPDQFFLGIVRRDHDDYRRIIVRSFLYFFILHNVSFEHIKLFQRLD